MSIISTIGTNFPQPSYRTDDSLNVVDADGKLIAAAGSYTLVNTNGSNVDAEANLEIVGQGGGNIDAAESDAKPTFVVK